MSEARQDGGSPELEEPRLEPTPRVELERRLESLTRELVELRSLLRREPEALPARDYRALAVTVAGQSYAIPVEAVGEVLELVWPEPTPELPPWVLGSMHYGGEQVPVLDLRQRLHGQPTPLSASTKLVVVEYGGRRALVVDAVEELLHVGVDAIIRPPADLPQSPFLLGSLALGGGRSLHLLSLERSCRELAPR